MNKFDKKLPETTTYWQEGNLFFVKHTSFKVSMDEARGIGELLVHAATRPGIKAVIIDSRDAKGVWAQEINEIWAESSSMSDQIGHIKFVTLANSVTAAMQINRLARNNGWGHNTKGFYSDMNDEVQAFIEA